jgi:hypothetical protein
VCARRNPEPTAITGSRVVHMFHIAPALRGRSLHD